jgi:hypothetical protein
MHSAAERTVVAGPGTPQESDGASGSSYHAPHAAR